ncbi:hypothetical protein EVB97_108 [Rhizobium phage RHph_Y65]|uniref:Uncharacterized protein n=1 Tax=Rhizobium phage RHph_Y65 TaxID=2509785 RepID=A0A7S5UXN1_9CAUD|nr:hypothetical protein PQC17_gp108 [Rhizobium phage RHph_Y65]QIG72666.1 hypothetical protein EVB97_108 [Rhizobium phage RHph_Y65]
MSEYKSPSTIIKEINSSNESAVKDWVEFQSGVNTSRLMNAGFTPNNETYQAALKYFNLSPVIPD